MKRFDLEFTRITPRDIETAYEEVREALKLYSAAVQASTTRKRSLSEAEAKAYRDGIEGKNAAERNAQLSKLLRPLFLAVEDAEDAVARQRKVLDLARMNLEEIRFLVRVDELLTQQNELAGLY